jgi:hypothetical protein
MVLPTQMIQSDQDPSELSIEISNLLAPYLDDQVLMAVFEARSLGLKDIVIYLNTIGHQIYQLERSTILSDPTAPEDMRSLMSRPSSEIASFGSEVPGYFSFWFMVLLPDARIAAMAISSIPRTKAGIC